MTQVLDLVTEALVTVKALAVGETAPASMSTTGLIRFNEVLDALTIQNLAVFSNLPTTFPLTAGVSTYTFGPSGSVSGQRPPFLDTAFVTYQGVDFDVTGFTDEEYASLTLKTQPGIPSRFLYNPDYPNGTLILWPVPSAAATMTIYQNKVFANAATLFDTFAMPPGYRRMIRLMLAWELVNDYPGLSGPELEKLQADTAGAIALVKRNNKKPSLLRSEVAELDCSGGGSGGNWRTGS